MILVDTSVWIGMFRANKPLDLERVVEFADVVTCPPIVQEVLQGIRDESAFRVARDAMLAMPMVESPMHLGVWPTCCGWVGCAVGVRGLSATHSRPTPTPPALVPLSFSPPHHGQFSLDLPSVIARSASKWRASA